MQSVFIFILLITQHGTNSKASQVIHLSWIQRTWTRDCILGSLHKARALGDIERLKLYN